MRAAYYEWLFILAREEAESGCPRLFSFKGALPMYFADLTASWTTEKRFFLISARIKKRITVDLGLTGTSTLFELTPAEAEVYSELRWPLAAGWRTAGKPGAIYVSRRTGFRMEMDAEKLPEALRSEASSLGEYKLNRRRLKAEIASAMKPAFGDPEKQHGGVWQYVTDVSGVSVRTSIDFAGRRPSQFRYSQPVFASGPLGGRLFNAVGVCGLLGFTHNEWTYVTEEDVPASAVLLARVCKEFVDAMPGILDRASAIDRMQRN
jgi:hypothetical protein